MCNTFDVIKFDNVFKTYTTNILRVRCINALDDVSFRVGEGEVVGLLGPNRAGKTTVARLLLTLCHPTSGSVTRLGRPAADRRTLARVGYMHDGPAFPVSMTACEVLKLYGALSGVRGAELRGRVSQLLEDVGLADRAHEPIHRFSKGMHQRLGLAQALINDPDLLVLDEPTEGLDLDSCKRFTTLIRERRREGRSALVITHSVSDVDRLCDRVIVLVAGRVIHDGPVSSLRAHSDGSKGLGPALSRLYREGRREERWTASSRDATQGTAPAAVAP